MIRPQFVLGDAGCGGNLLDTVERDRHSPLRPACDLGFVDLGCARQSASRDAEAVQFGG